MSAPLLRRKRRSTRSALDLIGNTPLVELRGLSANPKVRIFGKLEWYNPCGSVKDRPARQMVLDALRSGALRPGMRVLEATSGNTGTALAFVCRILDIPLTLVVPKITSARKREDMRRFAAELIDVPGDTTEFALDRAYEMVEQDPGLYYHTDQFTNRSNARAHEMTTGPEILAACPEVTDVVASVGSFGTVAGVGTFLRNVNRSTRIHAVRAHPGDAYIAGMREGTKAVPLWESFSSLEVKWRLVHGRWAIDSIQKALALGYCLGPSAALVLHVALGIAQELQEGHIVCILADSGSKYPGNPLYEPERAAKMNDVELSRIVFCSL